MNNKVIIFTLSIPRTIRVHLCPSVVSVLLLLSTLLPFSASMARGNRGNVELNRFQRIPVLYNGRHMPMDTFARRILFQLSGRESVEDHSASEWLARVLFDGQSTGALPVFLINHPDVARAIDVEPNESRRYSYNDLHMGAEALFMKSAQIEAMEPEERSEVEEELLRTAANMQLLSQLMQSFSFTFEHPDFQPIADGVYEKLELEERPLDALTLALNVGKVEPQISQLAQTPPGEWTPLESDLFRLARTLFDWTRRQTGGPLKLLPAFPHDEDGWLSPWSAMQSNMADRDTRQVLQQLALLREAWLNGHQEAFNMAADAIQGFTDQRLPGDREIAMIDREILYSRARFFLWSKLLYFPAFLVGFAAFLAPRKKLRTAAWLLLAAALIPHTGGMLMRMWIMGRPPVTNLYATFVFVSWICVALSLILEKFQKNGLGLLAAGFSGISLLMLSARFAQESDTLGKVVAVLDSNFWLSTHVLSITTGYAGCVLAGVIGHVYLIQSLLQPGKRDALKATDRAVFGVLAFGLIFSFLGTMLGGVWADQSWGRFWGWDPKENGALLIVLWSAILFHARLGGMIREVGFAVGAGLGIIIVMFAWIGVNLLGVGLHSYGFTSGLARGLFSYTIIQLIVLGVLGFLSKRRIRSR